MRFYLITMKERDIVSKPLGSTFCLENDHTPQLHHKHTGLFVQCLLGRGDDALVMAGLKLVTPSLSLNIAAQLTISSSLASALGGCRFFIKSSTNCVSSSSWTPSSSTIFLETNGLNFFSSVSCVGQKRVKNGSICRQGHLHIQTRTSH